jgi:hypothetical protein
MSKCDECTHLNQDKTGDSVCTDCIHRDHDLCCSDRFNPVNKNITEAQLILKQIEPKAEIRDGRGLLYNQSDMIMMFEKGRSFEWLNHKELRDVIEDFRKNGNERDLSKIFDAAEALKP